MRLHTSYSRSSFEGHRKSREARTGEHCLYDGVWVPVGRKNDARFIAEGSIMPASDGESVVWRLAPAAEVLPAQAPARPAAGASVERS